MPAAGGRFPHQPEDSRMLSPTTMRRLDYGLGVPLCFLVTIISKILALFAPAPSDDVPQNVLFVELAEMGSAVLAVPALLALTTRYPGAQAHFVIFKHLADSVRILGVVPDRNVLTLDVSSPWALFIDTLRFAREARRRRIDTTVNLEAFTRFSTLLGYLSGARRRVGFHRFSQEGLYTGDLVTHRVAYNTHVHTAQSFLTLVDAIGEPADTVPLGKTPVRALPSLSRLETDESARAHIRLVLQEAGGGAPLPRRLVLINPNASKLIPLRRWPLESYTDLVGRLVQNSDVACAIIGLASERDDAQFIVRRVNNPRVIDMTGRTTLRELIDLCNVADALVTNDSGPAHFAALSSVPVLVFFGPETPELYAPLTDRCTVLYSHYGCSPCVSAFNQRVSPCTDNQCLKVIPVADVHARVVSVIDGRA